MLLVATARELRRRGFYATAEAPPDLRAYLDMFWSAALANLKAVAESDQRTRRRNR